MKESRLATNLCDKLRQFDEADAKQAIIIIYIYLVQLFLNARQ